jgi:hypothetical protein
MLFHLQSYGRPLCERDMTSDKRGLCLLKEFVVILKRNIGNGQWECITVISLITIKFLDQWNHWILSCNMMVLSFCQLKHNSPFNPLFQLRKCTTISVYDNPSTVFMSPPPKFNCRLMFVAKRLVLFSEGAYSQHD